MNRMRDAAYSGVIPENRTVDLLLDSGAFSAWMRRETLDVKEYIRFVKEFEPLLWHYVNLDVIPGQRDHKRTSADVLESAKASYRNQQIMKDAGLRPMPVYHQGEGWTWLEKLLKDGEDYIGVSPFKDIPVQSQRVWLDQVFSILTDAKGRALVRTHGFGTTHPGLLIRYPWYTVDSTTWTLTPGYGQIIMPSNAGGKPNYLRPQRIVLSNTQHTSSTSQKTRFEVLGPSTQEWVRKWLAEEVGATVMQAKYGTGVRRKCVLIYYMRLAEALQGQTFNHRQPQFAERWMPVKLSAVESMPFHVVFATNVSREWSFIMTEANARTRLLSYYELKNRWELVEPYILHGSTNPGYERLQPKVNWKSENYLNYRALATIDKVEQWEAEVR